MADDWQEKISILAGQPRGCVIPVAVSYINQDGQPRENLIYFNPAKITRDTGKADLEGQLKEAVREMLHDEVVRWNGRLKFYIDYIMLDARLIVNR
ncbi:MAG: hypothetical protein HYT16_00035 [DPANN group archaeon]|nr:hypothetical protein [DPANN group archaeon]